MTSHGIATSSSRGRSLGAKGRVLSTGTPAQPNPIVRYSTVQEPARTNWSSSSAGPAIKLVNDPSPAAVSEFRFTRWSVPGGSGHHFYGNYEATAVPVFRDCEFGGGQFYTWRLTFGLTNCLWERVALLLDDGNHDPSCWLEQNTF